MNRVAGYFRCIMKQMATTVRITATTVTMATTVTVTSCCVGLSMHRNLPLKGDWQILPSEQGDDKHGLHNEPETFVHEVVDTEGSHLSQSGLKGFL